MLPTPSVCFAPSDAGRTSELTMCSVVSAGDIVRPGGERKDVGGDGRDVVVERFDDGSGGVGRCIIVELFGEARDVVVERFGDGSDVVVRCSIVERFGDARSGIVEWFGDARSR